MKITIPRQDFLDAVNKVRTVVSQKSALPILSHIHMQAEEGLVRLSATDLKVGIENSVDCRVDRSGQLTVSAQRLGGILSELPEADVTLELGDNNVINLEAGRIQTRLFSMSPEEFPQMPALDAVAPIAMRQGTLRRLFEKTSFAVCTDQARYNLTGLLFVLQEGRLVVVATDGRRMSLCIEAEGAPEGAATREGVIIPGKMVSELERLLGEDGLVEVYLDENRAMFAFDRLRLSTALIDGTFPNYEMVVPKKHDKEVILHRGAFLEAIRRTRTMTSEKFNSVRFALQSGLLTFRVTTPEVGEYQEELAVEYDGASMEIAFNPDFVADVLRHIPDDQVSLILKDQSSPGMIRPFRNDAQDENYTNVIMPIRI